MIEAYSNMFWNEANTFNYLLYHFLDFDLYLLAIYDLKFDLHLVNEALMAINVQMLSVHSSK